MQDKPFSKKRGNQEQKLQIAVCSYVDYALPDVLYFSVPNHGKRGKIDAIMQQKMGLKPGVSDLLFFWIGGIGAIELKVGKNKMTATQHDFANQWRDKGGHFACCYDLNEVEGAFKRWGLTPLFKTPLALQSSEKQMLQQAAMHELYKRD